MTLLIALIVSSTLFVGFFLLTAIEIRTGKRIFASSRASFDATISALATILKRSHLTQIIGRGAQILIAHIAHDITAALLRAVRMLERFLASMHVRFRKERMPNNSSSFVKTMSYFKRTLKNPSASPSITQTSVETGDAVG